MAPWDVEELFDALGERRFEELLAVNRADPWGEERADFRVAQATALAGHEGAEKVFWDTSLEAMSPVRRPTGSEPAPEPPQQSLEDMKSVLRMYGFAAKGGKKE